MFWFDKDNPNVLFQDIREVPPVEYYPRRTFEVKPDVIADFTNMPYPDGTFSLVVFDPPHLLSTDGNPGFIRLKYGALGTGWKEMLRKGFAECFRVLKPGGFLIFKWSECCIKMAEVLSLTKEQPLFGHRTGKSRTTIWICFMKPITLQPN